MESPSSAVEGISPSRYPLWRLLNHFFKNFSKIWRFGAEQHLILTKRMHILSCFIA